MHVVLPLVLAAIPLASAFKYRSGYSYASRAAVGKLSTTHYGETQLSASNDVPSATVIDKPNWAAGGFVSDAVNALIAIKPLFGLMKVGARNTLITTAEKNGIPWREHREKLFSAEKSLENIRMKVERCGISYPEYYIQEFHAYEEGNLSWEAAYEVEPATLSMAIRTWPKEALTVRDAQNRLRRSFTDALNEYSGGRQFSRLLDVGCSIGVSTYYLCEAYPNAESVDAIDLSPFFLAVAKLRQDSNSGVDLLSTFGSDLQSLGHTTDPGLGGPGTHNSFAKVNWIHANAESTGLPDGAYDLVACSFVFHELPAEPAASILSEMYRITAPGGVVRSFSISLLFCKFIREHRSLPRYIAFA